MKAQYSFIQPKRVKESKRGLKLNPDDEMSTKPQSPCEKQ